MRYGSVCSGIEAATVAWHGLGWEAAWYSEIEPFPCAVLAHHYPDVPNHGDMTLLPERIRTGEVEAPDILCGGTPCQAFSVAGKRQSLADARGNLTLTFCEVADAIDAVRRSAGHKPAIIVWENVPGVLNTADNAFGCFLAGVAGESVPLEPPGEKWTDAGAVYGPARAVAWRVLDAQYFGVAQRRRRVFVVASARNDLDPAAVLFEWDGLRRDSAPSREAGKVAPTIPSRSTAGGGLGTDLDCDGGVITMAHGQGGTEIGFDRGPTLTCNHEAQIAAYAATTQFSEMAGTLTARHDSSPCADRGMNVVAQPIALQDVTPREKAQNGKGWNDDGTSYTVDTHATQGVAQPYMLAIRGRGDTHNLEYRQDGTANALLTPNGGRGGIGVGAIAFAQNQRDEVRMMEIAGALAAEPGAKQQTYLAQPSIGWDEELNASTEQSGTPLRGGQGGRHDGVMTPTMQVRRLTPVECERLQGFPDNYTAIPLRGKPSDQCPDGPRYKAIGNSWAVPVVRWIGERIADAVPKTDPPCGGVGGTMRDKWETLHHSTEAGTDDWRTPREFFEKLHAEFGFVVDAAASPQNAMLPDYWTVTDNALAQDWTAVCREKGGAIWCNPPYGRNIGAWVTKAWIESTRGATVVLLTFARTDTVWWHSWAAKASEIRFVKGRLRFEKPDGTRGNPAPVPSVVLVFKPAGENG